MVRCGDAAGLGSEFTDEIAHKVYIYPAVPNDDQHDDDGEFQVG
jgi:hypothetical protein